MKSNIFAVMKKEFARFFGDRRMIIMLILPGVMIYVLYSFMGTALKDMLSPDSGYVPVAYTVNMPESVRSIAESAGISIVDIPDDAAGDVKDKISRKEADLCMVFPHDFDDQVAVYDVKTSLTPAPNIEIYYNSTDTNSVNIYGMAMTLLNEYQSSLAKKFDVNRDIEDNDLVTSEDASATYISSIMPMLLMIFLYTGCMSIAPESIAGEKERGTIATLLVTPLRRSELAIGKILSLGVLSFLCGLVSAAATMLSLPKLMGAGESISVNIYGAADYIALAFVILSTILLLVSLISIVSAFAKTVKEASTAVVPLMIIVMLVGVTAMFSGGAQTNPAYYIIPCYSSVQSMSGILALDYSAVNIALCALSNVVYACAGGFVLAKMFNSERIMFSR